MHTDILYIHGFNSSPQSFKAELTKQFFSSRCPQVTFHCPQISSTPAGAIEQLTSIIEQKPEAKWCLIGSSLGGYFSTFLSEKYQCPAILVNPAIKPYELLCDYIGTQTNPYTGEVYEVSENHMTDLKAINQQKITEKNYQVMVQTGDEVLDYRQATEKYQHCQLIVQQGGDHSFINFEQMLPNIAEFLML